MAPRIAALISTYKDAELLSSCIRSAEYCDELIVFDGPTNKDGNFYSSMPTTERIVHRLYGEWHSDADKRTAMLDYAKAHTDCDWGLWLDSDEILLWGEFLHDHCARADQETATGGTTLRIVEYDGSVAMCYGKLIKLDAVKRYVMSSYEIELASGMTVAMPNVPICHPGGIPYGEIKDVSDPLLAINRPPLQGEPHLLHRHGLRSPDRGVQRLHDAESDSFSGLVKDAGLEKVDILIDGNGKDSSNGT